MLRPNSCSRFDRACQFVATSVAVSGVFLATQATNSSAFAQPDPGDIQDVLDLADTMYNEPTKYTRQQLYNTLARVDTRQLSGPDMAQVLWRLARATYERAQEPGMAKEVHDALIVEAYQHVKVRDVAGAQSFTESWPSR